MYADIMHGVLAEHAHEQTGGRQSGQQKRQQKQPTGEDSLKEDSSHFDFENHVKTETKHRHLIERDLFLLRVS